MRAVFCFRHIAALKIDSCWPSPRFYVFIFIFFGGGPYTVDLWFLSEMKTPTAKEFDRSNKPKQYVVPVSIPSRSVGSGFDVTIYPPTSRVRNVNLERKKRK